MPGTYIQINSIERLPIRYEQFEGQRHIVAPVVLLVEGVHSGNRGPMLYPLEELAQFPEAWNGVPVTVGHPAEGSANNPDVLERTSIGRLFGVRLDRDRLRGEVWLNEAQVQQKSPEILQRLINNEPLEVSTGLFTENDMIPGTWNNEDYSAIARRFRPDHLAMLPHEVGACSFEDGCGIRANKQGDDKMIKLNAEQKLQATMNALAPGEDMRNRCEKVSRAVYMMDGPTADNYVQAIYEDEVVYRVDPGPQSAPGQNGKTYKRKYSIENGEVVLGADMEEVVEQRTYTPVGNEAGPDCGCGSSTSAGTTNEGGNDMPKNTAERKAKVDALLANTNAGFAETDREMLESMECEPFAAIEALAARPATSEPTEAVIDNEEQLLGAIANNADLSAKVKLGIETHNAKRKDAIDTITGNANNKFTAEQLEAKGLDELEAMAALCAKPEGDGAAPATNAATETPADDAGSDDKGDQTTDFSALAAAQHPMTAISHEVLQNASKGIEPMETPRPEFKVN